MSIFRKCRAGDITLWESACLWAPSITATRHTDTWTGGREERGKEREGGRQRETETDTVTSSDQDWKMEVSISQANSIELRKFPAGALEPFLRAPKRRLDREGWESKHQDGVLPLPPAVNFLGHPTNQEDLRSRHGWGIPASVVYRASKVLLCRSQHELDI